MSKEFVEETHTHSEGIQINTNGEAKTPQQLNDMIDEILLDSNKRLKKKYWKEACPSSWIEVDCANTQVTSGHYYFTETADKAEVILIDTDKGENHWHGRLKGHVVNVPVKVDDNEPFNRSFRVKYNCNLYYDPDKSENKSKATTAVSGASGKFSGGGPKDWFWFCPDNDANGSLANKGYFQFGKIIDCTHKNFIEEIDWGIDKSAYTHFDGTTFRLAAYPYFEINPEQEVDVFEFCEALNIVKALVSNDRSVAKVPSIDFRTSTKHGFSDKIVNRVILSGCSNKKLDILSEGNISIRAIEVVDEYVFRVIDPYVADLIQDNSIQKDQWFDETEGIVYLDLSVFEVLAEDLAAAIDYNQLINDVKDKYGGVEVFKREMVSVGSRGKLVGWINEQLQILQFPNSSNILYFDTNTYMGVVALKRYFKSMNEELYNGLGIGLGCNRDTTNLSGIEKTYCESSNEPCGCYTLGCMVFQEATDNRLETHQIKSAKSDWISGEQVIEYTLDHAHGLENHDNVIITRCKLEQFNVKSKWGITVGPDTKKFYVKLKEFPEDYWMFLTEKTYQPGGKVCLSQSLPTTSWNKLKQLNNSEPQTFIEKFSLNSNTVSDGDSTLYIPLQNLNERIKVKKGWGAVLRIYRTDSNQNMMPGQWGPYGNNVDYMLGSRDELKFSILNLDSEPGGLTCVKIEYDKRSNASGSLMAGSESQTLNPNDDGFLAIEVLTVRSTYGEWLDYGVELPADFGRCNGVAAIDRFIENMSAKFGFSGLSIKGGVGVKLAVVLEIALVFELKFGLIADASLELDSRREFKLVADIGVFASAGANLDNVGLKGTGANAEAAILQRYICKGRVQTRLMFLHLLNSRLGPLAVAFSAAESLLLAKMTSERVSRSTYSVGTQLPGMELKTEIVNTEIINHANEILKQIGEKSYSANAFSVQNKVENDILKVVTENLYFYNLLRKAPEFSELPNEWWVGLVVAIALNGVITPLATLGVVDTIENYDPSTVKKPEDYNGFEKNIHEFLSKSLGGQHEMVLKATAILATCTASNATLASKFLTNMNNIGKIISKFGANFSNLGALKGTFANLGSIVKSSDKKKELRLELGGGFIQTRPISNQTAKEAILSNAKNEAEQLENILNGNTHMIEKVQTLLQQQNNFTSSTRDFALMGKLEFKYELQTPRIPLFAGVKIGLELEFKAYAEAKLNLFETYKSLILRKQVIDLKNVVDACKND